MPFHRRAQDRTVAAFLETSLLIAGSLGALFGGPAVADTAIDTVRDLELRPGQSVTARHGVAGELMQKIPNKP